MMKAIVIHQYGGPEVLKFEEGPDPVAGPGEVPVQVRLQRESNRLQTTAGLTKDFYPIHFPGL
jgi:hypothetical protein